MAAIRTTNVTLNPENEFCDFIECCETIGAFLVIVKSEISEGCHAIFHIASANDGQKSVKRTVSVSGNNGEQLHIIWPEDTNPVLTYLNTAHGPQESRHFNIKVI